MCTVIEKVKVKREDGDEESGEVMVLFVAATGQEQGLEEGRKVKVWKPWHVIDLDEEEGEVALLCSRFVVLRS